MYTVKFSTNLHADNHAVFNSLLSEKIHKRITGKKSILDDQLGTDLSFYDGYAIGKLIELIPDSEIAFSFKIKDEKWYTAPALIVIYTSLVHQQTRVEFLATNVPMELMEEVKDFWKNKFFTPLKRMYSGIQTEKLALRIKQVHA